MLDKAKVLVAGKNDGDLRRARHPNYLVGEYGTILERRHRTTRRH